MNICIKGMMSFVVGLVYSKAKPDQAVWIALVDPVSNVAQLAFSVRKTAKGKPDRMLVI